METLFDWQNLATKIKFCLTKGTQRTWFNEKMVGEVWNWVEPMWDIGKPDLSPIKSSSGHHTMIEGRDSANPR